MNLSDSSKDESDIKEDIMNYKGYFVENEGEDLEPKYFEFGAHFPYKELCKILEELRKEQIEIENKKNEEDIKKINEIKKLNVKKIENRERNNTRNKDIKDNLRNILAGFNGKIRSRNIDIKESNKEKNELTYIPFNHNINNLSF